MQGRIDHEDDLRLTFGTRASMNELYTKGNMAKVNITLFTKKVSGISKEICILADFCNSMRDVNPGLLIDTRGEFTILEDQDG